MKYLYLQFVLVWLVQVIFNIREDPSVSTIHTFICLGVAGVGLVFLRWRDRDDTKPLDFITLSALNLGLGLATVAMFFKPMTILFLEVDFQLMMTIHWIAVYSTLFFKLGRQRNRRLVFGVFAVILTGCFWQATYWDAGYDKERWRHNDNLRLGYSFVHWESMPVEDHMYMAYDAAWYPLKEKEAYHSYNWFYLMPVYWASKLHHMYTDRGHYHNVRLLPLGYAYFLAIILAFVAWQMGFIRRARTPQQLVLLLLGTGLVITSTDMWIYSLYWQRPDTIYPLAQGYQLAMIPFILSGRYRSPLFYAVCIAFTLQAPRHAGIAFVAILFLNWLGSGKNRRDGMIVPLFGILLAALMLKIPPMIVKQFGITVPSGEWMSRWISDGKTFTNLFSAAFYPQWDHLRQYGNFEIGIWLIVGVIVVGLQRLYLHDDRRVIPVLRALGWSMLVFFLHLMLFTQAVSVHPYLFDTMFAIPAFFAIIHLGTTLMDRLSWHTPMLMGLMCALLINNYLLFIRFCLSKW